MAQVKEPIGSHNFDLERNEGHCPEDMDVTDRSLGCGPRRSLKRGMTLADSENPRIGSMLEAPSHCRMEIRAG